MVFPPDAITRAYRINLGGLDCYVRATGRSRARYIAARSFADADFGTIGKGLSLVKSVRLHGEHDAGPEGCWTLDGLRASAEAP